MKFYTERIKKFCSGFGNDFSTQILSGNVKYMYWRTDAAEYTAAFEDGKYADGTISDIRFFRIWKRTGDDRNAPWTFFGSDYLYGAEQYPIEMFMEEVGETNMVTDSFEMNEWQFNTIMGFLKK